MPVGVQQQVLVVTVQKTAEVPHVQFIDKVVAVPVDNLLYGGYGGDEGFLAFFLGNFSRSVHPDVERQVSPR